MIYEITPELESLIFEKYSANVSPAETKKEIEKALGCKKTKANEIYNEVTAKFEDASSDIFDFELEAEDPAKKPYFNKTTGKYVVFINCLGRNIVVSENKHKQILEMYSDWDGEAKTLTEICRAIQWPRQVLTAYLKAFQITHESLPLTDEELAEYDDEELASRLRELRKFNIYQKLEKEGWDETRADAAKWKKICYKQIEPFTDAVRKWIPNPIKPINVPEITLSGKTLVIGLADIHWGLDANERYMYNGKGGWTTEKTCEAVRNYAKFILEAAKERNYQFDKVVILFLGDFIHSLNGKTARGTELKFQYIKEEQFEYALDSLTEFVGQISSSFPKTIVHSVGGNHSYDVDMALYYAVKQAYRHCPYVEFYHHSTRPAPFMVDTTLFLMDHGADSVERTYVPSKEPQLKAHVNSLLAQRPDLTIKAKRAVFVQGDRHTHRNIDMGNFEFVLFGSSVGADEHASVNNWTNRPRQSCLVLDENGIKEIIHFYTNK